MIGHAANVGWDDRGTSPQGEHGHAVLGFAGLPGRDDPSFDEDTQRLSPPQVSNGLFRGRGVSPVAFDRNALDQPVEVADDRPGCEFLRHHERHRPIGGGGTEKQGIRGARVVGGDDDRSASGHGYRAGGLEAPPELRHKLVEVLGEGQCGSAGASA